MKAFLLASAAALTASAAWADYPERPVRLIVGFSAGGGTDTSARGFGSFVASAPTMNEMPMVVVNQPGGSGLQAAQTVADADPDGYTLYIINNGTMSATALSTPEAGFDPRESLTNLGCVTQLVTGLQVPAGHPATTAAEWVEAVKSSGETVRWSTSGAATMHAIVGHLFMDANEISHQVVPFRGGSNARNALVAGDVAASFNGNQLVDGFEDSIKVLGVPSAERDPANEDVPTFAEQGLEGLNVTGPMCVYGPTGLPEEVVADVSAAIQAVTEMEGFGRFMGRSGLASMHLTPEEGAANLSQLYETFGPVVEQISAAQN
ncbi:Bug family tripartite tricarboxylate transporter substrate binding protein [Jannaschia aquimarina]|uniref:Tripartite tricarboxylate transporter family receptor n=1 Tax=Jannaschia aquimarina TaxID=935700 RepID=A0A0D1EKG8_9RHOB|nr:tripartite tricarboxylate transporter substrate binding protein [Jannaschia aquimarina]KIT16260.1 Tripartite tricarboxylate transporter family receptor [Jannaschia aquimarina]SNT15072.1 Tripartite-type tricarboxylate transporter, receptor component TctC [Jannaschia aquimarina]